jgi:fatty-acyl-CoA synthase
MGGDERSMSSNLGSLAALIENRAPSGPAFVFDGVPISRKEFAARVDRTARWLAAHGIGEGDVVAVWLLNRLEWIALLFAAARLGATVAAVNTRYRSAEVAHVLRLSGAKLLFLEAEFRSIDFLAILRDIGRCEVPALKAVAVIRHPDVLTAWPTLRYDAFEKDYPPVPEWNGSLDSPVLLYTTSGTTKGPKLVAHSHNTLTHHARAIGNALGLSSERHSLLAMLPFCGTFGLTGLLAFFAAGVTVHVLDAFDAEPAFRLLTEHKISHCFGSDEMFRRVLAMTDAQQPFPYAEVFGFAAFQPGWREFAQLAVSRGVPLYGLYGSSELQALFSIGRADAPLADRIECGGWPMSHDVIVRVRDTQTGEIAAPGVSGELEISAPSRFIGYFRDPDATAAAITADGFFRTGDIGRLREDGSFIYETRAGDAMRLGGFLVSPSEIEDELKACPGVTDAQVVGIDLAGQSRCAAFIIPDNRKAPPTEQQLIARLRERLAAYKIPARIFFIDTFPVTESANGIKIQRGKLREIAMEKIADESRGDR